MSSSAVFHVTVKGVLMYQGKFLILKKVKPSKDHLGYWELPGGGMEYDETAEEAMLREALEETGLQVKITGLVSTFHVVRPNKQIVGITFLCECPNDHVVISKEHTEYLFVTEEEAKAYLSPVVFAGAFKNVMVK